MKALIKIFLALFIAFAAIAPATAQTKKSEKKAAKAAAIKQMIESKDFTFEANYAYPSYGIQRYLTPNYDLRVTKDTVVSFLPFMGVAYSGAAFTNSDDNGIKFTSTNFTYTSQERKNGTFYVVIKPKDAKNANQLALTISPNGYADLSVLSTYREQMRFTGIIKEKQKK
jgi:hypothetical protein